MGERVARAKFTVFEGGVAVMEENIGLRTVDKLSELELRRAYVVACRSYDNAYKAKKEIETEMRRRFEKELEENRR